MGTRWVKAMKNLPLDPPDLIWLRHLSRALLADEHAAEDLTQDTLGVALSQSVPEGGWNRAWLRTVANRLASRSFRSSSRRDRREQIAARPDVTPDTADVVDRADMAARVVDAARKLPEPFRTAILRRFLDGVSPEAIACETDRPVDTVRWRIRRGLELLRADLTRGDPEGEASWRTRLLPLAAWGVDAGRTSTGAAQGLLVSTAVGIVMKAPLLYSLIALLLIAGTGIWSFLDREPIPVGAPSGDADQLEPFRGEGVAVASADGLVHGVSPILTTPFDWKEPAGSSVPEGRVGVIVDAEDRPVAGARVLLVAETAGSDGPELQTWMKVVSGQDGTFLLPDRALSRVTDGERETMVLSVVANGFLRRWIPGALTDEREEAWRIRMERGRALVGRVVDPEGRPVPGLDLLASTARAGISHVSTSSVLMRAERKLVTDAEERYQQCRARTDQEGLVRFAGLQQGVAEVRSLDVGWTIDGPGLVGEDENEIVWQARPTLGVRVTAVDVATGRQPDLVRARFQVDLGLSDGTEKKLGAWVGKGPGTVSFSLGSGMIPDLGELSIVRATFFGIIRVDGAEVAWRSDPIEHGHGVVDVRVRVVTPDSDRASETAQGATAASPEAPKPATLEFDVRGPDGDPFPQPVYISWRVERDGRLLDRDAARPEVLVTGLFRVDVPAGATDLRVAPRMASGSLPPWSGRIETRPGEFVRIPVELPIGGTVRIMRPSGFGEGTWRVHASYRKSADDEWFGSWNYGTDEDFLLLNGLVGAEWRFRISRNGPDDPDQLVRLQRVSAGESVRLVP